MNQRPRLISSRDALVFAGSMGAIAALTATTRLLPAVSPMTVALALLLVVLGAATLGRLLVAIVVSIVAMLVLNFFFLPPVGTFTIADPENWVALVAFLIAWKMGHFQELDRQGAIPLLVEEEDYYTPEWAQDEEEWEDG